MIEFGYALSSEEHSPNDLVKYARRAEESGFAFALISDHYHSLSPARSRRSRSTRMNSDPGDQSTGGRYFTVANARIYTLPEEPPPIFLAAGGNRTRRCAQADGSRRECERLVAVEIGADEVD
jgi:alkanesulfonate monooxygenase SsuD/methylene tetrahydromethanopterin reductase-like flavin-dependent oxidoreductase (luciferase family)